jgi:SAM-dependent methyltransferase
VSWADPTYLRDVQYRTDANLAARQSIYSYLRPYIDLPARVLDAAGVSPHDTVADIGCGNGKYLAELRRRGHRGRLLGADMSTGMLRTARAAAGASPTGMPAAGMPALAADASALLLRSAAFDVTFANHMLYHVPDPATAIGELRRITRAGGTVAVTLNGADHLRELDLGKRERIQLNEGEALLRSAFPTVTRHDFVSTLELPGPEPIAAYVRSMGLADPEVLTARILKSIRNGRGYPFPVTTHSGTLVCA